MSKKTKEPTPAEVLGLTEEEYLEKFVYYAKHQKEFEHQKRKKEYDDEQKDFADYISKTLFSAKFLKENGYEIFDIHQANEDFRKVLKLDEINEIAGVYQTCKVYNGQKKFKEHIVPIKKQNFYNAFYQPIWENLTLAEKIKSLEWMFETINEEHKLGIKGIDYFPNNLMYAEEYMCGYFNSEDNSVYININYLTNCVLKEDSYIRVPVHLAHELMHARQQKYANTYNFKNKTDFYTLSQTDLNKGDYETLSVEYGIDYATEFALYRTSLSEKTAELQAYKTIKKYIDINNKTFGKRKIIENDFKSYIWQMLFAETSQRKVGDKAIFEATPSIITNEEIVLKGQTEFLQKLLLLRLFYEYSIEDCNDCKDKTEKDLYKLEEQFLNGEITHEEYSKYNANNKEDLEFNDICIAKCIEKLNFIKATFKQTLKTGKKPDDFDEKVEFEPLKLIDEPKLKYSLPRWLHELEDKNRKNIERQKKKFGIANNDENNENKVL